MEVGLCESAVKSPPNRRRPQDMELQDRILEGKYPAKDHCAKVVAYLKSKHRVSSDSILYLEGQKSILLEDSDEAQPFRYALYCCCQHKSYHSDYSAVNVVPSFTSVVVRFPTAISPTISPPLA